MKLDIHNSTLPFHKHTIGMLCFLPKYNRFNPINKLIIYKR